MDQAFARFQPAALSLFRFITGLVFLHYGLAKWLKFPTVPMFANPPTESMVAGGIELVGGTLLLLGLFTRPVAFVLSGQMAIAYFWKHMFGKATPEFFPLLNGGMTALILCFVCLYLATAGGGPISLDATLRKTN